MTEQSRLASSAEAERWEYALEVLAARVAQLIDDERQEGDVADNRRGKAFPLAVIHREATSPMPQPASGIIPWNALPESLTDLAEDLPITAFGPISLLQRLAAHVAGKFFACAGETLISPNRD